MKPSTSEVGQAKHNIPVGNALVHLTHQESKFNLVNPLVKKRILPDIEEGDEKAVV